MEPSFMDVVEPLPCGMLRFGLACGNDAFDVLCVPHERRTRLIPMCQMCIDDSLTADHDWMESLGKTCHVIL